MGVRPYPKIEEAGTLELAAEFYASVLWDTEAGASVRARLLARGVADHDLRAFGVGYSPGAWDSLLSFMEARGRTSDELLAAGLAIESRRGHVHVHFRSRVMFPMLALDGAIIGFAGFATNPGPSWPEWLTSPESGAFARGRAIFGLEQARKAIARTGRAVVVGDCLEVPRRHREGTENTVAVVRSELTLEHLETLATLISADTDHLAVATSADSGCLIVQHAAGDAQHGVAGGSIPIPRPRNPAKARQPRAGTIGARATALDPFEPEPARLWLSVASAVLGIAIPVAALWGVATATKASGVSTSDFLIALGGVVSSYLALALTAAVVSARARARTAGRRMRLPWERGATEWQPTAWTYHSMEELLVRAALVSVLTCMGLFITVGGFLG